MKYSLNKFIINITWSILGTLVSYSFCRWDRKPGNTNYKNFNWHGSYCQWNWPDGNKFHMLELTYAICTNNPKINEKPPVVPLPPSRVRGLAGSMV